MDQIIPQRSSNKKCHNQKVFQVKFKIINNLYAFIIPTKTLRQTPGKKNAKYKKKAIKVVI